MGRSTVSRLVTVSAEFNLKPDMLHVRSLQASGLWRKLEGVKAVVQEPRGTGDDFDTAMRDFYAAIDSGRGCIFFAVCRGKVRVLHYTGGRSPLTARPAAAGSVTRCTYLTQVNT